tara:strand:- start:12095 stop:12259 length:165 start_codon:yes stop_codon:yes gene_type:complete
MIVHLTNEKLSKNKLSFILPVLNEVKSIRKTLNELIKSCKKDYFLKKKILFYLY